MKDRTDDMAEEFRRERKTLSQIEKAQDAVRRKYRLLKEGKQAVEKALGETFKPIVNPLERPVTVTDTNVREIKNLMPKTEVKEENQDLEASSFKTTYDDTEEEDEEESTELPKGNSSVEKYLHLLNMNRKKFRDMTYGLRKLADSTFMIGDSPIRLENEYVILNGQKYMSSVGLLELLFMRQPDAELISAEDKNNYGKILKATNAYRKHFRPDEVIQKQNSNKYKTYIAPFSGTPTRHFSGENFLFFLLPFCSFLSLLCTACENSRSFVPIARVTHHPCNHYEKEIRTMPIGLSGILK